MTTIARNPTVLWRRSADRVVLRPRRGAETFVLEGTARLVWLHLDGPITVPQLTRALARRFQADEGDLRNDVAAFVGDLVERGLVIESQP